MNEKESGPPTIARGVSFCTAQIAQGEEESSPASDPTVARGIGIHGQIQRAVFMPICQSAAATALSITGVTNN